MSSLDMSRSFEVAFPPVSSDLEDLRAAWRDACEDLHLAHRAWRVSPPEGSAEAYWVVVAAADREEAAADVLQRRASSLR
jgi:hypothetical protein